MVTHPFDPIYNRKSKVLILGTFPSVASRSENFYYGHSQNRFWKVLAALTANPVPETIENKKALLLTEKIALWDVLRSCDIDQSKDSSIINPIPNDFGDIFEKASLLAVFTNGKKADELYKKLCYPKTNLVSYCLPSTSPANASWNFERLLQAWGSILHYIR